MARDGVLRSPASNQAPCRRCANPGAQDGPAGPNPCWVCPAHIPPTCREVVLSFFVVMLRFKTPPTTEGAGGATSSAEDAVIWASPATPARAVMCSVEDADLLRTGPGTKCGQGVSETPRPVVFTPRL